MDEDEEITMRLAADICRNRRSDDVRRRTIRVPTEDAYTQTESSAITEPQALAARFQKLTSIICYLGFALVVHNLSQLRLLIRSGGAHRHYSPILLLLLSSLALQCTIACMFVYITRKDTGTVHLPAAVRIQDKYSNFLIVLISAVTLLNIAVFVLS